MEGYIQHISGGTIKRYVQFLEISDNPALIEQYRKWHSEEYNWQEVRDGIRAVGILEMEIYIFGSKLVMIVDAPADFQWEEAMSMLATLPRQQEWEDYMAMFQQCREGATSDEKWQMMERMFYLYWLDHIFSIISLDFVNFWRFISLDFVIFRQIICLDNIFFVSLHAK